jgi:hypothetical protein
MRYVTAVLSSVFMFLAVGLLCALALLFILPAHWAQMEVRIGSLGANMPSLAGLFLGALAATYTFRASLKARTGRLYRRPKRES